MVSYLACILIAVIPYFYDSQYQYNQIFLYCMWDIMRVEQLKQFVYFIFVPTFAISNLILGLTSIANIWKLQSMAAKSRSAVRTSNTRVDSLDRASRTALIVVLAFTLCYLPRYSMVFFVETQVTQFWFYYKSVSEMLIYINSAINPLIYIFRSKQFINEISILLNMRSEDDNGTNNGKYVSLGLGNITDRTARLLNIPRLERTLFGNSHSRIAENSESEEEKENNGTEKTTQYSKF